MVRFRDGKPVPYDFPCIYLPDSLNLSGIFYAQMIANIEFFLYNNDDSGEMFSPPGAGADHFPLSICIFCHHGSI